VSLRAAFERTCRERRLRRTTQRLAVFEELASDPSHPTAESLFDRLRARFPTLSLATVYRTLEAMKREGLVRTVQPVHEPARFDANLDPHQHLVCRACGRIEDVSEAPFSGLRLPAGRIGGFRVEEIGVTLLGRCGDCEGR
jgi:Fur family peroxide stress response transcriptional regulator